MIDIHCHILPGLDDGPETLEESIEMSRIAYNDGIRTIVATPHYRPGSFEYPHELLQAKLDQLKAALVKAQVGLEVLPGADVTITPELNEYIIRYPYLTINGTGRYFLAEFPHAAVPPNWDTFLYEMIRKGKTPIITHPERNGWFLSHPEKLSPFVRAGGLVQITAMSVTGEGSEESRRYAVHLIKSGLAHIIATDAHSRTIRKPLLSDAVALAVSLVGKERATAMVVDTPRAIVEGRPILTEEPIIAIPKRRTWFQKIARI